MGTCTIGYTYKPSVDWGLICLLWLWNDLLFCIIEWKPEIKINKIFIFHWCNVDVALIVHRSSFTMFAETTHNVALFPIRYNRGSIHKFRYNGQSKRIESLWTEQTKKKIKIFFCSTAVNVQQFYWLLHRIQLCNLELAYRKFALKSPRRENNKNRLN